MKLALALLTKDKPELTRCSIEPLLQPDKFDLWQVDGSRTGEGRRAVRGDLENVAMDVFGGPDAAIVFALTKMLVATEPPGNTPETSFTTRYAYTHVGIIEQDVLLHPDWFGPTLALFERGEAEGLKVGAVSARSYEDRILIQRDGYAVMHNLGAGMIILTREAAQIILSEYRTGWAPDNRLIFSQLAGIDIGRHWAFRGAEQWLTADWNFDAILACHGLASLALTPSLATMLDQDIAAFGLKMADGRCDLLRGPAAFDRSVHNTRAVRAGDLVVGANRVVPFTQGAWTIFPHQIEGIGGKFSGDWRLRWAQGFGPFAWQAGPGAEWREAKFATDERFEESLLEVPILGPCEFLISGGTQGGKVELIDAKSGYKVMPELAPEGLPAVRRALTLPVPGGFSYRTVRLTCLTPGCVFYGLRTTHAQPWHPTYSFDWSKLPRAE